MARIVECPCGHTLSTKQHIKEHHPDSSRSEDEICQLVDQMAQDA